MITIKRYLPLFVLAVIYLTIALTQLPIIDHLWRYSFDDGTYSHAYLIPFISIYLYWILFQSGELVFNEHIRLPILVLSIIIAYVLWVSINAQFPTGYRISFVLFIAAITAIIFKPSVRQLFPALFLIFLVPVWGITTTGLQSISTFAVTYMMSLTHIPIYVEGNTISIPAGVFEIAGGCSGLRYLLVSLAISSLFIFLNIKKYSHALLFLSLAIIGAFLTNWLRITILILVGHYTDMQSSLMHDHNSFGWYLYIPFMAGLFYFGRRYTRASDKKTYNIKNHNMKLHNGFIALAIIFFVANPRRMLTKINTPDSANCPNNVSSLPLPQLVSPISSCLYNTENGHKVKYGYDGNNLEQSVDHYLNEFTPKDWKIIKRLQNSSSNILLVAKQQRLMKISYSFTSGNDSTTSLFALKKLKLMNALSGESRTALIWHVQACNSECLKLFAAKPSNTGL